MLTTKLQAIETTINTKKNVQMALKAKDKEMKKLRAENLKLKCSLVEDTPSDSSSDEMETRPKK